ncbi:MAG TPA: YidC/Oxa1 family membrane protein insertase [Candidatus Limnocylindria bacterium]|nr:YidC/Oxa1 family membrane protein insertase [Candidatus Limnocylindria bacterium]
MTDLWNTLLVHPLINLLVFTYSVFGDFGLAIVIVTVSIRLLLYPLFVTQIRSQRALQELAPAMNELKQKYGKDRQKLTEEQMKLYRERGYNPAAGCLPLLLQMPILFGFYAAMLQMCGLGTGLAGADCPGITREQFETIRWPFLPGNLIPERIDLAAHWLPWISGGLGRPDPFFVLPILAGVTQLVSSLMAMPAQQKAPTDPQARMMQTMTYYFPIITVVIAWGLPAGLSLYWVATTVFQIAQQYVVTGWGQLARWLPFLRGVPTPADRTLKARQQEAIEEAERDMRRQGVRPERAHPGDDRAAVEGGDAARQHRPSGRGRRRGRRR